MNLFKKFRGKFILYSRCDYYPDSRALENSSLDSNEKSPFFKNFPVNGWKNYSTYYLNTMAMYLYVSLLGRSQPEFLAKPICLLLRPLQCQPITYFVSYYDRIKRLILT